MGGAAHAIALAGLVLAEKPPVRLTLAIRPWRTRSRATPSVPAK